MLTAFGSLLTSRQQERLIYGDYMIPGAEPTVYEEVPDLEKLTVRIRCEVRLNDASSL